MSWPTFVVLVFIAAVAGEKPDATNFVMLLADDLGWADVSPPPYSERSPKAGISADCPDEWMIHGVPVIARGAGTPSRGNYARPRSPSP